MSYSDTYKTFNRQIKIDKAIGNKQGRYTKSLQSIHNDLNNLMMLYVKNFMYKTFVFLNSDDEVVFIFELGRFRISFNEKIFNSIEKFRISHYFNESYGLFLLNEVSKIYGIKPVSVEFIEDSDILYLRNRFISKMTKREYNNNLIINPSKKDIIDSIR